MESDFFYKSWHVDSFNSWIYNSICDDWEIYDSFKNQEECNHFISGVTLEGYYNVLMEYIFISTSFLNKIVPGENITNNIVNEQWISMVTIGYSIIHCKNEFYIEYIINLMYDIPNNAKIILLSVILTFLFISTFGFLLLWLPYLINLILEICSTISMLFLISIYI